MPNNTPDTKPVPSPKGDPRNAAPVAPPVEPYPVHHDKPVEDHLDHTKTYPPDTVLDHQGFEGPAKVDVTPSRPVGAKPAVDGKPSPKHDLTPEKAAEPKVEHKGVVNPEHNLSATHKPAPINPEHNLGK